MSIELWQCTLFDSLTDYPYADSRIYATREDAEKRAKRMTYSDDCVDYWATVHEVKPCWDVEKRVPYKKPRLLNVTKSCPFCGSSVLYELYHNVDGFDMPMMFCNSCKAEVTFEGFEDYVTGTNDGMSELRSAWNRRADA